MLTLKTMYRWLFIGISNFAVSEKLGIHGIKYTHSLHHSRQQMPVARESKWLWCVDICHITAIFDELGCGNRQPWCCISTEIWTESLRCAAHEVAVICHMTRIISQPALMSGTRSLARRTCVSNVRQNRYWIRILDLPYKMCADEWWETLNNVTLIWGRGVAFQHVSLQQIPMKISKCPVAPIRVAMICHCLFHITASFDERKGILYTAFSACAGSH